MGIGTGRGRRSRSRATPAERFNNGRDFVPTNPDAIKQIEVVRGPASAVWGANALTGVVNIITKSPRESAGATSITIGAGWFNRDFGSTAGQGVGGLFNTTVTTSQVANDRWSYRLSGGYYASGPYARPVGRIPVIADPRDPDTCAVKLVIER